MPKHLKLLTLGSQESGKTCLIKRYCEERFEYKYLPTIGLDYGIKVMQAKTDKISVIL